MYHGWSFKNPIVNLPIKMKGNSKYTSGKLLSPLGAQNEDISAALQMSLTKVKCLQCRLALRHILRSIWSCSYAHVQYYALVCSF